MDLKFLQPRFNKSRNKLSVIPTLDINRRSFRVVLRVWLLSRSRDRTYHVFTLVTVQNHLSGVAVVTDVATRKKNEHCGDFLSCKVFTESGLQCISRQVLKFELCRQQNTIQSKATMITDKSSWEGCTTQQYSILILN